jgi:peptidyl-prolyl cis-trans isomerase D
MSVIQNIRDKYARWAVIAIAVALLGFILMDAFAGKASIFSGRDNTVGKVNGRKIDAQEFAFKIQDYEKKSGAQGENRTEQAVQEVWNQEVGMIIMNEQFKELGLGVSDKELRDILYGANPPQDFKQNFTDPATGIYNAVQAQQQISQINRAGTAEQKQQLNSYLNALENQRMMEKYNSLLLNTVYAPKWFIEKRNADNSLLANVSYVSIPYTTVPDNTVKVSDDEINTYVKNHKKDFELKEESRSINYVLFSAAPSKLDSAAARNSIMQLKTQLDTATKYDELTERTRSVFRFYDGYISKKNIQNPNKDSILSAPVGVVSGPYVDAGYYEIAKIIDVKNIPDTVNVRHILISTTQTNPQTGEMMRVRDDSSAKRLMDSVQGLLNAGQPFDSLVVRFSEDQGSKANRGVYENVFAGQMVGPFNDFIFTRGVGERGVVKTDFGYHLVEVLSQRGNSPAYKVAYLTVPIETSQETDNQASNDANMFSGNSHDIKSFNENWEKNWRQKGVNKLAANDLKPLDFTLTGMNASARSFIKKIFDAKKGEVVGPDRVGENYIVAVVAEIDEPGLPSANKVRSIVEPVLRNKKKAEQIKKNIGNVTDLNQLAAKVSQAVQTVDSLTFEGRSSNLGFETRVIGAAFNPANKGKISQPVAGQVGVYVLRVNNVATTPVTAADIQQQRMMLEMQTKQMLRSPLEALIKAADVKDYRANFY